MKMWPTWAKLRTLSDEELIARHDEEARTTVSGTELCLGELRYREQSRLNQSVRRYTRYIFWLTVAVTLATIVNVVLSLRFVCW